MGLWRKRRKNPKLPLQFYNHNFMVLKFSKTKYTNQSTNNKKITQTKLEWKLSSSCSRIWPRFRPVFKTSYVCIYTVDHSVELKILEIITYLFFIKTQGNVSDRPYETPKEYFFLAFPQYFIDVTQSFSSLSTSTKPAFNHISKYYYGNYYLFGSLRSTHARRGVWNFRSITQ